MFVYVTAHLSCQLQTVIYLLVLSKFAALSHESQGLETCQQLFGKHQFWGKKKSIFHNWLAIVTVSH